MNSAAPAVRDPYSVSWLDYDIGIGVSIPGAFAQTDFDNHGDFADPSAHARAGDFVDLNVGGTLQLGALGFAATADLQQFSLSTPGVGTPGVSRVGRWKALAAYGFWAGQVVVGAGLRVVTLQVLEDGVGTLLTMTGAAPEAGALVMPTGSPWRAGATLRAPVSGGIVGSQGVTPFALPSSVVMPWEVEVGIAYQLGPRPLNPGWQNPHEQEDDLRRGGLESRIPELRAARQARYENWPRERILLLASLLMTGPSGRAVSLEGFFDQRQETVGRNVSLTPRLGLEGEPLRDRMVLRVGTYLEPSRYDKATPRQHFTFGGDVRLFPLDFWGLLHDTVWKLGFFVDLAPRYANGGIGVGTWH